MLQAKQISIIGTGLLGGSIGLGLRAGGFKGRIVGLGRRLETVEKAREIGCVDQALPLARLPEALRDSQVVILATPISTFTELLEQIVAADHDDLAITDAGSTKQFVCAEARRVLPKPQRFIGAHPMAGGERHGPQHARADLFRGRPCILTPETNADPKMLERVEELWKTLGMRLVRLSASEHDAQAARISHLPHLLAALLVQLAGREGGLDIASTGFRDTTRIASSDPQLWADVFATNGPAVISALDALLSDAAGFKDLLASGDHQRLIDWLQESKDRRDRWLERGPAEGGE
jgi:prephenate dehydrogenase